MKKLLISTLISTVVSSILVANERVVHHTKEQRLQAIPLNIIDSQNPIGFLNSQIIFLSDQLERNSDRKFITHPVMVTSFLNLDNFNETSGLGRLISESLIHELQVKQWKVVDARLARNVIVNKNGEFALSRDVKNLKSSYNIAGVITGTYTVANNGIIINAKVMDIKSGVITSSGQIIIPLNGLEGLLSSYSSASTIKIKGSFD